MYRVEIGITYIHTYGLGTSQDPTYIGPQYKKKTMYVEISIYMGAKWGDSIIFRNEQNTTKITHKYKVLHTIYTPYANL